MKPEEVIELLKIQREDCSASVLREDDIDYAISALEKQIPNAYDIRCNADGVCYDCPDCGIKINRYANYCENCGQAIDWGNEE